MSMESIDGSDVLDLEEIQTILLGLELLVFLPLGWMLCAMMTLVVVCPKTTGFPILDAFGSLALPTSPLFATECNTKQAYSRGGLRRGWMACSDLKSIVVTVLVLEFFRMATNTPASHRKATERPMIRSEAHGIFLLFSARFQTYFRIFSALGPFAPKIRRPAY